MGNCRAHHHSKCPKRVCKCGVILLVVFGVAVFITWAILRPEKPQFMLKDATIYSFNVSSNPNLLTSTFQVTVSSRNGMDKVGIYYDKLDVYASYRNQQITMKARIPRVYEGHQGVNVWSPLIYGTQVPISANNAMSLGQDLQANGYVLVMIKLDGRLRWRVGGFTTTTYNIFVQCPVAIPFGNNRNTGVLVENNGIKYQVMQSCSVTVHLG